VFLAFDPPIECQLSQQMLAAANRLKVGDVVTASELLKPCDAQLMRGYPVSTRINHVANDDEGRSAPVELAEVQRRLFP
jgi:hypothetical protein